MAAAGGLRDLAHRAIREGGRSDTPFGLYVFGGADDLAELARDVERRVFLETFGNTQQLLAEEYGPYEASSTFLCVLDHEREAAAGLIRILSGPGTTFKSLADLHREWGEAAEDVLERSGVVITPEDTFDIATLAVAPEYRGTATDGLVSLALYHGVAMLARDHSARLLVTILDLVVLDLIQTRTHRPFSNYAGIEPMRYLDSPSSLPVYCDLDEYRSRVEFLDPTLHDLLFEGRGLEAVLSTPWSEPADESRSAVAG